jgi:hypothetical protein
MVPPHSAGGALRCIHCHRPFSVPAAAPAPRPAQILLRPRRPAGRPTSGLGTASLVLGIVGVVLCWVPGLGVALCGVGVCLGFPGLLTAAIGKRRGVGLPIAGLVVSLVGLAAGVAILAAAFGGSFSFERY